MSEKSCPVKKGYSECWGRTCAWWYKGECVILSIARALEGDKE